MIAPKAATDTCFLHEQSFLAILEFVFVDLSNNLINKTPQKLKILWSHLLSPSVYLKAPKHQKYSGPKGGNLQLSQFCASSCVLHCLLKTPRRLLSR